MRSSESLVKCSSTVLPWWAVKNAQFVVPLLLLGSDDPSSGGSRGWAQVAPPYFRHAGKPFFKFPSTDCCAI